MDQGFGPAIQPSAWVGWSGLTLSVWGNVAADEDHRFGRLTELDPSITWEGEWRGFSLSPSFACYLFPGQDDPFGTAELTLSVSRPLGPVEVFTDHSIDVVGYPGAYYGDLGLGFEHELTGNLSVGASADVGWATAQFNEECLGVRCGALNCAEAGLGLTWVPFGFWYLRPHVGAGALLDTRLRAATERPTNLVVGLAAGWEL
jgi:hypothetical protein